MYVYEHLKKMVLKSAVKCVSPKQFIALYIIFLQIYLLYNFFLAKKIIQSNITHVFQLVTIIMEGENKVIFFQFYVYIFFWKHLWTMKK